jgi:hypothetical protein
MSVTYNPDPLNPYSSRPEVRPLTGEGMDLNARPDVAHEPFVPVYARRGKAARTTGKVPAWMILAPVGVIALGAIAAMLMLDNGGETTAPLAEPAATAPVVAATPLVSTTAPLAAPSTPAPVRVAPAAAPVVREAAPVRRAAAPAPVRRATTPSAPVTRTATPAPAPSSTTTLNTAPTPPPPIVAPEPTPPAPVIVVEPLS